MHEIGIVFEIINITLNSIKKNKKINIINLQIGKLSTIVPANLIFCFKIASRNTLLFKTKLNIKIIPVIIKCKNCKKKVNTNKTIFKCINCKSNFYKILSGKELDIFSIEIKNRK